MSPITAYVRRAGDPIGPASTRPRFTPTLIGGPTPWSTIDRSVRSMRSSSFPPLAGAPATRYSLPPLRSMSDSSHVIARSCVSDETMSASSPSVAAAAARSPTSVSVPENLMKAAVACLCSASTASSSIGNRSDDGTSSARSPGTASASSSRGGGSSAGVASRRNTKAPSRSSPTSPSSASALRVETRISPDSAASSSSSVADADGPQTISSRWCRPSRKK